MKKLAGKMSDKAPRKQALLTFPDLSSQTLAPWSRTARNPRFAVTEPLGAVTIEGVCPNRLFSLTVSGDLNSKQAQKQSGGEGSVQLCGDNTIREQELHEISK